MKACVVCTLEIFYSVDNKANLPGLIICDSLCSDAESVFIFKLLIYII